MRDKRDAIVDYSKLVYEKGWVANHEGNLSTRISDNQYLATPTSFSKRDVTERDLIVVDEEGALIRGFRRPFSEFALHKIVYQTRSDVGAVIHAHPPHSTAFSIVGRGLERPVLCEQVVSIGPTVPLVPFAVPKTDFFTASLVPFLEKFDVLILENHGVISCGVDLEQAFLRLEYCESLAKIQAIAAPLGNIRYLTWNEIQPLLDSRKKAGLGPEARGLSREDAYGYLR